jgi:hypothetical protein
MPKNPSNARWFLALWFKDTLRSIRRRNISLYFACKTYNDIDQRLEPIISYHVFMRGAELPDYCMIHKNTSLKKLSDGEYYIVRDGYGLGKIDGIKPFENEVIVKRVKP